MNTALFSVANLERFPAVSGGGAAATVVEWLFGVVLAGAFSGVRMWM